MDLAVVVGSGGTKYVLPYGEYYYADESSYGDPYGPDREEITAAVGLTTELSDDIIAEVWYSTYNGDDAPDASFTLQVFLDGILYQEETGTITIADFEIGARLNYRWFDLCGNVSAPAHAVGAIEMGGTSGTGESCLVPNDPPGQCYSSTWTFPGGLTGVTTPAGGREHTFEDQRADPNCRFRMENNFYANNLILRPPGWGCEDPGVAYSVTLGGFAAKWDEMMANAYANLVNTIIGGQVVYEFYQFLGQFGPMSMSVQMVFSIVYEGPIPIFGGPIHYTISENVSGIFSVDRQAGDLQYIVNASRSELVQSATVPNPDGTGSAGASSCDLGEWYYSQESFADYDTNIAMFTPPTYPGSVNSGVPSFYAS